MLNALLLPFLMPLLLHAPYESVAQGPRFETNGENFSFYWAVWRSLSPLERARLQEVPRLPQGALISERTLSWNTTGCADASPTPAPTLSSGSERIWTLDPLELDDQSAIVPSPYGPRTDNLYFVQLNLNGIYLRSQEPYLRQKRDPGESSEAYRQRTDAAWSSWHANHSPRGAKGQLLIEVEHRVFLGTQIAVADPAFRTLGEHEQDPALIPLLSRLKPDRWPLYHDERAHKPHTYAEPASWTSADPLSKTKFIYSLTWNWCDLKAHSPELQFTHLAGPVPTPGPNRPDRDPSGTLVPIQTIAPPASIHEHLK